MSLSKKLAEKEIGAKLKTLIRNPGLPAQPIRVPNRSGSPRRVGTAFDYLVRYGLAARFTAVTRMTGAEAAAGMGENWGRTLDEVAEEIERFHAAKGAVEEGTSGQELSTGAAKGALVMADLEFVYRTGRPDSLDTDASASEIEELKELFAIVPWEQFKPKERVYLNPEFGDGTALLSGADADIVIDHIVIEIKTVKKTKVDLAMVRQTVLYALLANEFGLNREGSAAGITELGFYLSRSGALLTTSLDDCIDGAHRRAALDAVLTL